MKNIIIFYQVINREFLSCENLKKTLETENDIRAFIFSIDFEHYKAVKLSKKIRIDMVIMPWMYMDSNYELVQPFIENNLKVYIVNLHQEQIGSEISINALLPTGNNSKNSVIHFVWGDFFKSKLLDIGVMPQLIYVTGNMRSDESFRKSKTRIELSKEFKLDMSKRWILFSENRGWILINGKKHEEEWERMGFSKHDINLSKSITRESLKLTVTEFNDLPDSFFEINELIYRPHPGTEAPSDINTRIKVIYKYSIYDWLASIDVNIAWSSTTIFESDIKKIPSIIYEPIINPKRQKTYGLEYYPIISSFLEIDDSLLRYYKEQIAPKNFYEKYIGYVDGQSTKRVKEEIIKILYTGVAEYNAKKMHYPKKNYVKKYLFQKITKLFVLTNLLELVKYPHSAYELKNDIPYKRYR